MDGWTDKQTDEAEFIGPFWLKLWVQKRKGDFFKDVFVQLLETSTRYDKENCEEYDKLAKIKGQRVHSQTKNNKIKDIRTCL